MVVHSVDDREHSVHGADRSLEVTPVADPHNSILRQDRTSERSISYLAMDRMGLYCRRGQQPPPIAAFGAIIGDPSFLSMS